MAWRDTMRPIKLWQLDARVLIAFIILLPAPYKPVLIISICFAAFFVVCNYFGLSVPAALRRLRSKMAGKRYAHFRTSYRRIRDYGGGLALTVTVLTACFTPDQAHAGFQYQLPAGAAAQSFDRQPESMAAAISRIVPNNLAILYDQTVDPTIPAGRFPNGNDYSQTLQSLLWAHGLTSHIEKEELWVFPRGLQLENFKPTLAGNGKVTWHIKTDEHLIDVLTRWSKRVGVKVVRLTDRTWDMKNEVTISGTYTEAVDRLFFELGHLPNAPIYQFSDDGRVLSISHRRN